MENKPRPMIWPLLSKRGIGNKWPEIKWPDYDPEKMTEISATTAPHVDIAEATTAALNAMQALDMQTFRLDAVQWRLVEPVEGESSLEWLKRADADFYDRIKAEVERCSFCRDEPHILYRKIMQHLDLHPDRLYLLNMALREEMTKPLQMIVSEEQLRQFYTGHFPYTGTCKCGVAWDSMLYGATCAKCGEKRPRNAVIHRNVTGAK